MKHRISIITLLFSLMLLTTCKKEPAQKEDPIVAFLAELAESGRTISTITEADNQSYTIVMSDGEVFAVRPSKNGIVAVSHDDLYAYFEKKGGLEAIQVMMYRPPKYVPPTYTAVDDSRVPQVQFVDLGLSVKWADCNVGAASAEESGYFYAYGETRTKAVYSIESCEMYKYSLQELRDKNIVDARGNLLAGCDVAASRIGSCRMPTLAEMQELVDSCEWTWTTRNEMDGYEVKGPNGNTIFLPAGGYFNEGERQMEGRFGAYRTATANTNAGIAYSLFFYDNRTTCTNNLRNFGYMVRAVRDLSTPEPVRPAMEYVDLGLPSGLKWATCNLGATSPEQYGNYYAWGEITTAAGGNYSQSNCNAYGKDIATLQTEGVIDGNGILKPAYDAARQTLGGAFRMPTNDDFKELVSKCTWTWYAAGNTEYNGRAGYKVEGNGNSIFLPVTGTRYTYTLDGGTAQGAYWSSKVTNDSNNAYYLVCGSTYHYTTTYDGSFRYYGKPVRAVYDPIDEILPTSVKLDYKTLDFEIMPGTRATLTATVFPTNATDKSLTWTSSDPSVADVDNYGVITPQTPGTADIVVSSVNGKTDTCKVTVIDPMAYNYVDLGLPSGLKWATCNLGATTPEEYGDYYAWGEITMPADGNYSEANCNAYEKDFSTLLAEGVIDEDSVLTPAYDVARQKMGGSWRMPTKWEQVELRAYCTWTWYDEGNTEYNGVAGYRVTSKTNGNSIFLPAAGFRSGSSSLTVGSDGYYRSSLASVSSGNAYSMYFRSSNYDWGNYSRYGGQSVRPVKE